MAEKPNIERPRKDRAMIAKAPPPQRSVRRSTGLELKFCIDKRLKGSKPVYFFFELSRPLADKMGWLYKVGDDDEITPTRLQLEFDPVSKTGLITKSPNQSGGKNRLNKLQPGDWVRVSFRCEALLDAMKLKHEKTQVALVDFNISEVPQEILFVLPNRMVYGKQFSLSKCG